MALLPISAGYLG